MRARPVRTALLGFHAATTDTLKRLLKGNIEVVLDRPEPRDGLAQLIALQPQAVLIWVGDEKNITMQYARRIRHDTPDANVLLVCAREDPAVTREAMRLGCRFLCVVGEDESDLRVEFQRMAQEEHTAPAEGLVVAILGAKGGMGTTSLAINLAGLLASDPNRRVALVDLALFIGEVAVYLDMSTPYSLGELVRDLSRIDSKFIERTIPKHRGGFFVLSQPTAVEDADALTAEDVVQSIIVLKRFFTHVVLDAGAQLSDASLSGVHAADQTLLVCTQELPSLVSTRRRVGLLTQLGGDQTRTRIVVNRWNDSASYGREQIEKYVQHGISATVRNDYASMSGAIEAGQLLVEFAPDAEVTHDIEAMIPLFDDSVSAKERSRKKLFGLF
jgi:pilus assembly protein CpaE